MIILDQLFIKIKIRKYKYQHINKLALIIVVQKNLFNINYNCKTVLNYIDRYTVYLI